MTAEQSDVVTWTDGRGLWHVAVPQTDNQENDHTVVLAAVRAHLDTNAAAAEGFAVTRLPNLVDDSGAFVHYREV